MNTAAALQKTRLKSADQAASELNPAKATVVSPIRQEEATNEEAKSPTTYNTSSPITIDLDNTSILGTSSKPYQSQVTSSKLIVPKTMGSQDKPSGGAKRKVFSPIYSPPPAKHAGTIRHNTRLLRSRQPPHFLGELIFIRLVERDLNDHPIKLETSSINTPRTDP